jgi:hypothetical protein
VSEPIWHGPDLVRDAGLTHVDEGTRRAVFEAFEAAPAPPWPWLVAGPPFQHHSKGCGCTSSAVSDVE